MADSQTPTNTEGTLDSSEVAAAVVSSPKPTGLTAPANTPRGSVSEPEPALLKSLQKQSVSNASEVQSRVDALALNEEDGEQEEVDAEGEDEEDEGVCVKALRDLQTKRHELQMVITLRNNKIIIRRKGHSHMSPISTDPLCRLMRLSVLLLSRSSTSSITICMTSARLLLLASLLL